MVCMPLFPPFSSTPRGMIIEGERRIGEGTLLGGGAICCTGEEGKVTADEGRGVVCWTAETTLNFTGRLQGPGVG